MGFFEVLFVKRITKWPYIGPIYLYIYIYTYIYIYYTYNIHIYTTSIPAHLFAIRGRRKRGPGTL